jgi:hypothetical protein
MEVKKELTDSANFISNLAQAYIIVRFLSKLKQRPPLMISDLSSMNKYRPYAQMNQFGL